MRPVMANSGLILQLVLDTQCSAAIADLSKAKRTLSALHGQPTRCGMIYVGRALHLARSRSSSLDWLGRVLPHPSCGATELSHGPDGSGGATIGTRVREIRMFDALTY